MNSLGNVNVDVDEEVGSVHDFTVDATVDFDECYC